MIIYILIFLAFMVVFIKISSVRFPFYSGTRKVYHNLTLQTALLVLENELEGNISINEK